MRSSLSIIVVDVSPKESVKFFNIEVGGYRVNSSTFENAYFCTAYVIKKTSFSFAFSAKYSDVSHMLIYGVRLLQKEAS
jgi:hypothetical protein